MGACKSVVINVSYYISVFGFGTCSSAAESGHLNVVKWARTNGCVLGFQTCSRASKSGHLDVLKWARANGCNWNSLTCSDAAQSGHLDQRSEMGACKWLCL